MKKVLIIISVLFISIISYGQHTGYVIEGQTYTNTSDEWNGVVIPKTNPIYVKFKNNSITAQQTLGYMLHCGNESPQVTDNNLDSALITGNKYYWNSVGGNAVHMMLTGYNINQNIRYNYVYRGGSGVIAKSGQDEANMTHTSGGVYYNIFINQYYWPVIVKGMNGLRIYNNTFYDSDAHSNYLFSLVAIGENGDGSVGYAPTGVKVKNNIFYTTRDSLYSIYIEGGSLASFECDYNVYWCEESTNNEPVFWASGKKTWTEWRAMGFDEHSVIINPQFNNTTDFVPTVRLDYGVDVGNLESTDRYDYGLATTAEWIVDQSPDTVIQTGTWQVGAVIMGATTVPSDATYFVAPWGNDANDGLDTAHSFKTWQKAFLMAEAGDTVYFRGGVYDAALNRTAYGYGLQISPTVIPLITDGDLEEGVPAGAGRGHSGTPSQPICFFNYPGETPILDHSNQFSLLGWNTGIQVIYGSFIKFKGLTTRNLWQREAGSSVSGWFLTGCNNIQFENCTTHDISGRAWGYFGGYTPEIFYDGVMMDSSSWVNCDAYNLCDTFCVVSDPTQCAAIVAAGGYGGNADGFKIDNSRNSTTLIDGCRAWNFSDNGIDPSGPGYLTIKNSWVFYGNQFTGLDDWGGEGIGIKWVSCYEYNYLEELIPYWYGITTHKIHNNISAFNNKYGFQELGNIYLVNLDEEIYNNTSYRNKEFGFTGASLSITTQPARERYVNNLSYNNDYANVSNGAYNWYLDSNNSWVSGTYTYPTPERIPLTTSDFILTGDNPADSTTAMAQLKAARHSDGSLPDITFLKLASTSDAIGAGIDVGLPYNGSAPDIGYAEYIPTLGNTFIKSKNGKWTKSARGTLLVK